MTKHSEGGRKPQRDDLERNLLPSSQDGRIDFDDALLKIRISGDQERIRLFLELSRTPGLTLLNRRQLLLFADRYLLSDKSEVISGLDKVLSAIVEQAESDTLTDRVLELLTKIQAFCPADRLIPALPVPLEVVLNRVLGRDSHVIATRVTIIEALNRLEEDDRTTAVINLATLGLMLHPFDREILSRRYNGNILNGSYGLARHDLDVLCELFPDDAGFHGDRIDVMTRQDDYDAALDAIEEFSKRFELDTEMLARRADGLYQLGRNTEALTEYDDLLKRDPENTEIRLSRIRVYEQLDFFEDANADLEKVLEAEPTNMEARQLLRSMQIRKQGYGIEDDLYSLFLRGDDSSFIGDIKIPEARFTDIGGLSVAKQKIRETIEYPLKFPEISKKYGKVAGGGLMFFGPPGCGKTLLARAAAGECGVTFINVSLASVLDKWVGNSEKAISMIFSAARKHAPSIIFLDEMDSIGGSRASFQAGWEKKLISQLLTELDGIASRNENVMVLGATNAPWDVDFALRRPGRLGNLLFIPPPDLTSREEIFRLYLSKKPFVSDDIDVPELARLTEKYSADSIRQLVENAAAIPWREAINGAEPRPLSMVDLQESLKTIGPDLAEWEKLVVRYEEFAKQSMQKSGIGFRSAQKRGQEK
ncbi:MAG: AAA family ATPase [Planctomycetales bacterium]|nr:AAA family ATPase [bacterium]UNM07563.1 MAG: AAA family ATPase [Planctomycetales bacterium]